MLKFKNKFKFGSSNSAEKASVSAQPTDLTASASISRTTSHDSPDTSPRASSESKRTIVSSTTNLSENMLKLLMGAANDDASSHARGHHPSAAGSIPNNVTDPSVSATSAATTSDAPVHPSPTPISYPGVLTVKIYNSTNTHLPIRINNNRQILQALALNANNEHISLQLLKNLQALDNTETLERTYSSHSGLSSILTAATANRPGRTSILLLSEQLPGSAASNLLPSIITIPSAENMVKSLLYLTVEFDNNILVIEPQKGTVFQLLWNQVVSFDVSSKYGSAKCDPASNFLNVNLFVRLPNALIPEDEKSSKTYLFTNSSATSNTGHSSAPLGNIGDLLIGTIKLPLNLRYHTQPIRILNHEFLKFTNYNMRLDPSEDALLREMGEIMLTIEFKPITKTHLSIEDFDLLKVIGKGSFGKVMQVIKRDTKQIYALKTLRKQHIVSRMEVTHTLAERTVLARITNPFIVPLKFSFQSPEKLYLVLSFINGGELFWHLQREGKFSMDRSRFYIAELLTALESLHELNVIYRDLKPENILLDYQGHIALCDFGLCKLNMSYKEKTNTFCGTPEYLAPELILHQGYTRSVDWWTLGILLYEMLTGLPPFYDEVVPTMYRKILQNPLTFPLFLEGTDAQSLLILLLQKDPKNRLDYASEIKSHAFFKDIDWNKLLAKSYLPPFKPNVDNLLDTSNFDQDFTNEKPQDLVVDDFLSESVQKQFGGWTYNGDSVF